MKHFNYLKKKVERFQVERKNVSKDFPVLQPKQIKAVEMLEITISLLQPEREFEASKIQMDIQ